MLLSDFLQTRNLNVGAGSPIDSQQTAQQTTPKVNEAGNTFAQELRQQIESQGGVQFSNHAIKRLESRSIEINANDQLERLNRGVEIAAEKGSHDSLILVDKTAYVVSIVNNKVITTLTQDDLKGNIFTNIDSTVII